MTKDGTTDQKDTSVATLDTSDGKKGTSTETPAFTEKTQAKAVSDALAAAGRNAKALEKREAATEAREQRIRDNETKAEEKRRERETKEMDDATPEERTILQRKQKIRERELKADERDRELTAREADNQSKADAAKATQAEVKVFDLATKYELNADMLKDLDIADPEQLERVAKAMSTKKGTGPDSGKTMGGSMSDTDFRKDFASGKLPMSKENIARYKNTLKE